LNFERKIYLINPKFQIKFALLVTILLLGVTLIYPYTIYQIIENISLQFGKKITGLHEKRDDIMTTLFFWQIGYSLIVFSVCIFFSHKIAGPLYRLNIYLKKISELGVLEDLKLRNGDYFKELESSYNQAVSTIRESRKKDFDQLEEIRLYLNNISLIVPEDKKIVISEINNKINEIHGRYQEDR